MSAVGIGLAWAFITLASCVALSASALASSRRELEVDPRGLNLPSTHWPPDGTHWPAFELAPTSPVLRCSPSVARMQAGPSRLEPVLSS
ncbi:MAG TPA: hypothetical protein VGY76_09060 [Solirubrobacteraceae bacterium]|jgi:hypothetical protein|nr:hypothetical protein [Solirubrobacteraceae bacterium]